MAKILRHQDVLFILHITTRDLFVFSLRLSFLFQLYELDDSVERRIFLDNLFSFMQNRGESDERNNNYPDLT